jgi:hypothetical protein
LTIGQVIRRYGGTFLQRYPQTGPGIERTLRSLAACRTAALGGQVTRCTCCGEIRYHYHSCGDRHCPQCGGNKRAEWLDKRAAELLPVPYFHVVFTLPHELSALALGNRKELYEMLFAAASETLLEVAADPKHLGARIGILMVLHTWGQQLEHHPHVHCVVPGGGMSAAGENWVSCRPNWFLPVKVLGRVFRGKYLAKLRTAYAAGQLRLAGSTWPLADANGFAAFIRALYKKEWVVYSKEPFGGPEQVLKYLTGYTHRVAISNHRLVKVDNDQVTFTWKDYADNCRRKEMTLTAVEFVRRFSLHILPKGLVRIRQYGLLANRGRGRRLAQCRVLLGMAAGSSPQEGFMPQAVPAPSDTLAGKMENQPPAASASGLVAAVVALLLLGAGSAPPSAPSLMAGMQILADVPALVSAWPTCAGCGGLLETIQRMARPKGPELEENWHWNTS